MKIIAKPVGTGKTKELIKLSLETKTPILCQSQREAHSIIRKSLAYFGEIPFTLQYDDLKNHKGSILIDNAEKLLEWDLARYNPDIKIAAITLSTEN